MVRLGHFPQFRCEIATFFPSRPVLDSSVTLHVLGKLGQREACRSCRPLLDERLEEGCSLAVEQWEVAQPEALMKEEASSSGLARDAAAIAPIMK